MPEKQRSRELSAKQALRCIRSNMSNAELMKTFKISPAGLADLLKQLFEAKLITEDDLRRRGIQFKVRKRETEKLQVPPLAPLPADDDEEFLDTVRLTEMLTLNGPKAKRSKKEPEPEHIRPLDLKEDSKEKKRKLSKLGSLFKKES